MRNLTKTLAAVSLLVPASAYPLGIGDIKLHSALNQTLDAEIALLVSSGENVSDISVRLAPPEKFDEAGVPWNYFLSKIKFEAVTRANGSTVVKLTSKEALREPFLDFLLEVTWATGNLYREFTVLVDPPAAYLKPVIPVIQKPEQLVTRPAVKPVNKLNQQSKSWSNAGDGQYGLTDRSDSLWKVAAKTNAHDDVSIEQMMMAIYKANPRAFYKQNVNALMAGKTLNIPEKEVVLKLSKKQALAAFKQQNDEWLGRVSTKPKQAVDVEPEVTTQLELEAPEADQVAETAVVVTGDDSSVDGVTDSALAGSAASGEEGVAVQAKVEKLEQQLLMMQKMLVLKDEQIAALQNNKVLEPDANTGVASDTGKTKAVATEVETKSTKPVSKKPVKTADVKKKPKKLQPVVQPEEETDYLSLAIGGTGVVILAILGLFWWRKRKDEEQDADTESMFASASEISLPDSSIEDLAIQAVNEDQSDSSVYDVGTVGESSFLSEFTPSDFDAFDTDQNEVDPISEADVYLAYGRYQQAEDLMRDAIKDYPDRDECKLKLFEIFYANENKASFETYAKELFNAGKHEDMAFWVKVAEMGRELDPESSLYDEKASFDVGELEQDLSVDESVNLDSGESGVIEEINDEADFDLSVFDDNNAAAVVDEHPSTVESDDNGLDFDLSVFDLDDTQSGSESEKEPDTKESVSEGVESIDFDLDSVALDDAESEEIKIDEVEKDEEIESFDFDLEADSETKKNDAIEEIASSVEPDIDLESFDFSADDKEQSSSAESEPAPEVVENIEDFDFDFDLDTPVSAAKPETDLDAGVSDLTDMDELETKLDLAKAYIDMGDAEAAKDIAEEVLAKGTAEQKKSAQEILSQLG